MIELKSDFHLHTCDDLKDYVGHTGFELIDCAAQRGFKALAITNHDLFTFNNDLKSYASDHDILLIPGIEKKIAGKHVLLLNAFPATEKIETFDDLYYAKKDGLFVIAPHPFFKARTCLGRKLINEIELFDAIEYCFFYSKLFNLNRRAVRVSRKVGLPLIGNSDCHLLEYMGVCHSMIAVEEKSMESVFSAIRNNSVNVVSRPIFLPKLPMLLVEMNQKRRKLSERKRQELTLPAFEFGKELEEVSM
ncbi:PHP domain-containing protein [candidate division KSB1 bacterium]|nr:PHP domain-containing protein [candidate division KSB1 bacterium]